MTAMSRFMTRRHVLATVAVAPFSRAPLLHAQIPGRLDPPVQKVQAVIAELTVAFFKEFLTENGVPYRELLEKSGEENGFAVIDREGVVVGSL